MPKAVNKVHSIADRST